MIEERIKELTEIINKANHDYYVNDNPTITDQEYDRYMEELMRLEEAHPEFRKVDSPTQRVGSEVISEFKKVTHEIPMLSLGDIFNEEEYQFENPKDNFLTAKKHFIYGKAEDDTGLIVNDFVNIGLRSNVGKILNFENPVFGWLSGPQGAQIYVARLGKMAVFVPKDTRVDEDAAKKNALNWLSGSEDDKYFEFSGASQSTEFVGNDDIKNIHVNVGTSAYGWNVSFDNGVTMSLRDLQEFEGKHGKMPSENGEISHGPLKLKFSNVEKMPPPRSSLCFLYIPQVIFDLD